MKSIVNCTPRRRNPPRMLWPSDELGTYIRKLHGPLPPHPAIVREILRIRRLRRSA